MTGDWINRLGTSHAANRLQRQTRRATPLASARWGWIATVLSLPVSAQVTLDGTLGSGGAQSLSGPDYQISADLGARSGSHLFHSFDEFSISVGESATFLGPADVTNVIGRVTGGAPSTLDGLLRSAIPGADLYLINPAGVMFGPNARLDVSGSFHASSADYLRFADGTRFSAAAPESSQLSVAPVAAFGFLHDTPAGVSLNGGQLRVNSGETLSLIGGEVRVDQGNLIAPDGRINVAGVAGAGEVRFAGDTLDNSGRWGDVTIAQTMFRDLPLRDDGVDDLDSRIANLDASGDGAGRIVVRAATLSLPGGFIFSDTRGGGVGQGIDIAAARLSLSGGARISTDNFGAGTPGAVRVFAAESILLADMSSIGSDARDQGPGGEIVIRTSQLTLDGGAISLGAAQDGDAGSLDVEVDQLDVLNGGTVIVQTSRGGDGGQIRISATRSVTVSGASTSDDTRKSTLQAATNGAGKGGQILVDTPSLTINDGAVVESRTNLGATGAGGSIAFNVGDLSVLDGARVDARTQGEAGGGSVAVNASGAVLIDGADSAVTASTDFTAAGGVVQLTAASLTISDGGSVQSRAGSTGVAGDITIDADQALLDRGAVSGEAQLGDGGNVTLRGGALIFVNASSVTASAGSDSPGGNITLDAEAIVALDDSDFVASAQQGVGGNIFITADTFLRSADIDLNVTSGNPDNDGTVLVDTPELDISGSLAALPGSFFNAAALLASRCGNRDAGDSSRFVIRSAVADDPTGWLSSAAADAAVRSSDLAAIYCTKPAVQAERG